MNKKYCVYMHTSPSNKRYIGITCQSTDERWRNGDGYKRCTGFYRAIQKYGWGNIKHEVLLSNLSFEEATSAEKDYIKKYKTHNKYYGYNCTDGGEGVCGWKANEEQREKNRQAKLKQWQNPEFRTKLTIERQQRGATVEEKERLKQMSIAQWGNPQMRARLTEHLREIAQDESCKKVRSQKLKELWIENPERFMNNRQYKTGVENKTSKPVRCIDTGIVYANAREADRETGISYKSISNCANGKQKATKGTRWEFVTKT